MQCTRTDAFGMFATTQMALLFSIARMRNRALYSMILRSFAHQAQVDEAVERRHAGVPGEMIAYGAETVQSCEMSGFG
jgi:hypothetical protein